MGFIIDQNSTPVYDGWGFDDYWQPSDWVRWHKALKAAYGKETADYQTVKAFTETPSAWQVYAHTNWRTIPNEFKEYAQEEGFHANLFTGVLGMIVGGTANLAVNATTTAQATANNVIDAAGNVAQNVTATAENLTKYLKYVLPVLVLVALYLGYKFFLNTKFAKAL